ncbi:MAG: hypothetical protein GY696_19415 [Gammaproteobacteria bacterium]|nr:hypothetical protein [Gammaproteobacteria bacterium]
MGQLELVPLSFLLAHFSSLPFFSLLGLHLLPPCFLLPSLAEKEGVETPLSPLDRVAVPASAHHDELFPAATQPAGCAFLHEALMLISWLPLVGPFAFLQFLMGEITGLIDKGGNVSPFC